MSTTRTFHCRAYTPDDYAMLQGWWRGHGVGEVPPGYLPGCGIMVEVDGAPAACAWLYLDNSSPMAWLAWVTTRPRMPILDSVEALECLLGAAATAAESQHRKVLFAEAPTRALERFYEAHGFIKNHPTVHYFKEVG